MEKQTRSILEEINSIVPKKDKNMIVESRADHVITSVINLVHLIKESYSEEEFFKVVRICCLVVDE